MTMLIEARNLTKRYGNAVVVDGVSFAVPQGQVFGYLGRNGSGKTTTVRMLTTLTHATSGSATVAGFDLATQAQQVKTKIGVTMQDAALDPEMTGQAHMLFIAQLLGFDKKQATSRAADLLEIFGLTDAANKKSGNYSGGMRRRLDIATALLADPAVLFLDEPTTGLDPQSRIALWAEIESLKKRGTTIFLTTQYLEEADVLADQVAIIDSGQIIAEGTPSDLKRAHGRRQISFGTAADIDAEPAIGINSFLDREAVDYREANGKTIIELPGSADDGQVIDLVRKLGAQQVQGLEVRDADLEDVFLRLTGRDINVGASA